MGDVLDAALELQRARDRRIKSFRAGIEGIVRAVAQPLASGHDVLKAMGILGDAIGEGMMWADVLGQRRLLLDVDARARRYGAADLYSDVGQLAKVEFTEATEDILTRDPRIARTAEAVAAQYNGATHGFALAKSAEIQVTEAVRDYITKALREGTALPSAEQIIKGMGDWTRSYAETVFRTNLSTAYTQGRMRQAFSAELDEFIPAFQRTQVGDSDTRENHDFTLVAYKTDPIWRDYSTPGGYNCRCVMQMVDRFQASRMSIPARASIDTSKYYNDTGFTGRVSLVY